MTPIFNKEVAQKGLRKHMAATGAFSKLAGKGEDGLRIETTDTGGFDSVEVNHEGAVFHVPLVERVFRP